MEKESFEDSAVAELLNENFICIKVDREERPDIDQIYMTVCQMLTGSGGWPLTIILTPELKPFFAGTYFPKYSVHGRAGMMELVPAVARAWKEERAGILSSAVEIVEALQKKSIDGNGGELDEKILTGAFDQLKGKYDDKFGGFGAPPKFAMGHNFLFLLRYWKRSGDARALEMVEHTLTAMRLGGIYDQIGYGFHRYSTDQFWLLPHFEKMLYDQALLSMVYLEVYQATGNEFYARTAKEIFAYVARELTSSEGGFYSAEDADSEGEEGKYYFWTPAEILEILGEEDGKQYSKAFNVEAGGNFAEQATGKLTGASIPYLKNVQAQLADGLGVDESDRDKFIGEAQARLLQVRNRRVHPSKDDKILTDWNGLMIASLAKGAVVLNEPKFAGIAAKAADFLLDKMILPNGDLQHRYRNGEAGIIGKLDDYSFLVYGLIELHQATFDIKYLSRAIEINDRMLEKFRDDENGGLFLTSNDESDLIVRPKESYDGSIPSGNSMAFYNMIRLSRITGNAEYEQIAVSLLGAISSQVVAAPMAYTQMLVGLDYYLGPSVEIVIAGDRNGSDTKEMLKAVNGIFLPNKVVLLRPTEGTPEISEIAGYTKHQVSIDGKATAYICRNFACNKPMTDIAEMTEILKSKQ